MMVALCAAFLPITSIATALRLAARIHKKASFGLDDVFAVVGLLTFFAFMALSLWAEKVFVSAKVQTPAFSPSKLSLYFKSYWITGVTTPSPISCAKFSILFLYHRLFSADKPMRVAILWTGVLCLAWWIAATVAFALQCVPVSSAWIPVLPGFPPRPGYCYDYQKFYIGIEIPNCILDFWVVVMPIFELKKLHLSLRTKVSLSAIFCMAGFVGVVSIVRMVLVYHDPSPFNSASGLWITIQLAFAVICCNLPTYRPLVPEATIFLSWYRSVGSLLSKGGLSTAQSTKNSKSSGVRSSVVRRGKNDSPDQDSIDNIGLSTSYGQGTKDGTAGRDVPLNSIKMTSTVEIV